MRYAPKKHYEWSSRIAYSVGLMASDGCLQSDGRHLDLTSVDIEQLENFSKAIGRIIPISLKGNKSQTDAFRVQFSDVAYYDFLISIGLTPRKSHTIADLNIPDQYYSHFLRGLFDGDGTTYAYYDSRWKNSYLYYIGFTSASKLFLEYLSIKNIELLKVSGQSIRRGSGSTFILGYAKKDSYKLYRAMYENADLLYLSRKRTKLEAFIEQEKNDIILSNARVL